MNKYLAGLILFTALPSHLSATADGPTFFKVQKVESNDVLNLREAPNWKANKVGEIPHDGRCILNLGCIGGLTLSESIDLSEAQKKELIRKRPMWCQVKHQGFSGWASGAYLSEDNQCNDDLSTPSEDERHLTDVMHQIVDALNHKKYQKISEDYVDPKVGLYMLYNVGTATIPYHFKSFEDFMRNSLTISMYENKKATLGDYFFGHSDNSCDLKMEQLPDFCAPEKEGCFAETPTNYRNLKSAAYARQFLRSTSIDITEDEINKSEEVVLAASIDKTIKKVVSFNESRLGFSLKNGKWHLVVIDLSDCSA